VGVGLCWLGNGLTAASDGGGGGGHATNRSATDADDAPPHSFLGDSVCLAGAVLYASYTVAIRKLEPEDLSLFFGFLGLTTMILFAPLVALLHWTSAEDVSSLSGRVFGDCHGRLNLIAPDRYRNAL